MNGGRRPSTPLCSCRGPIAGPGTATSDDVPTWASNGEFMMRTAAVRRYGVDFMNSVNDLRLDSYVGAPGVPSGGGVRAYRGSPTTMHVHNTNTFVLENHGAIGSQIELENWFVRTLDNVSRTGRMPNR